MPRPERQVVGGPLGEGVAGRNRWYAKPAAWALPAAWHPFGRAGSQA